MRVIASYLSRHLLFGFDPSSNPYLRKRIGFISSKNDLLLDLKPGQ